MLKYTCEELPTGVKDSAKLNKYDGRLLYLKYLLPYVANFEAQQTITRSPSGFEKMLFAFEVFRVQGVITEVQYEEMIREFYNYLTGSSNQSALHSLLKMPHVSVYHVVFNMMTCVNVVSPGALCSFLHAILYESRKCAYSSIFDRIMQAVVTYLQVHTLEDFVNFIKANKSIAHDEMQVMHVDRLHQYVVYRMAERISVSTRNFVTGI